MASPTKRTAAVKILLSPDIDQQLRHLGDRLGQTPATLASVAVSQWVAQQIGSIGASERAFETVLGRLMGELAPGLQKLLSDLSEGNTGAPLAGAGGMGVQTPHATGSQPSVPGPQGATDPYSLIQGNKVGKHPEAGEKERRPLDGQPRQLTIGGADGKTTKGNS